MKEITRIHIAKQAYDIELTAKKDLEKYMKKLEAYAGDEDILKDIEIRITELLADMGVVRGGVISDSEVMELQKTLGEPEEFASDDIKKVNIDEPAKRTGRRLYRDVDEAILGGVLSGIGRYLGISALGARLVFIVLLLVSFGTVLVVYFVLWAVLPPAKTAAEKLELEGREVTLASIREVSERTDKLPKNSSRELLGRVVSVIAGLTSSGLALGALALTVGGVVIGLFATSTNEYSALLSSYGQPIVWLVLSLLTISGLLLTALGVLLAYASFARKFTKKIAIATIAIIISGLLTFGSGVGVAMSVVYREKTAIQSSIVEKKVDLPADFANVKSLKASAYSLSGFYDSREMSIQYIVDPGQPRYVLRGTDDTRPDIRIENGAAKISFKNSAKQNRAFLLRGFEIPSLTIYGPALEDLNVEQGVFGYTAEHQSEQESLRIKSLNATWINLFGNYKKLEVSGAGSVDIGSGVVYDLSVNSEEMGAVNAGVVRNLTATYRDACQSMDYSEPNITVAGVSSGVMNLNGQEISAVTQSMPCMKVVVGNDDESME